MPTGQPNKDSSSLRRPSQVVLDYVRLIIKAITITLQYAKRLSHLRLKKKNWSCIWFLASLTMGGLFGGRGGAGFCKVAQARLEYTASQVLGYKCMLLCLDGGCGLSTDVSQYLA